MKIKQFSVYQPAVALKGVVVHLKVDGSIGSYEVPVLGIQAVHRCHVEEGHECDDEIIHQPVVFDEGIEAKWDYDLNDGRWLIVAPASHEGEWWQAEIDSWGAYLQRQREKKSTPPRPTT